VQHPESANEPIEIGPFTTHHAVCILGRELGAIGIGSCSAHNEILDLIAVEYLNQAG
jgi:hypothetical protein